MTAPDPTAPDPIASEPTARDRAMGALVGLAAGDAVETTLEFRRPGSLFDRDEPGAEPGPWVHDPDFHAYWVEPGRLLAGEYPGDLHPDRAREKLALLMDHGVRTIVDLTCEPHLAPYDTELAELCRTRGLQVTRVAHPIPDMGVIEHSGYDAIMATIAAATARGAVYVHCWGGIGRTGTVVGCRLVDRGLDGDAACAEIARLRAPTRKARTTAPQTPEQFAVIRDRAQRSTR